MTPKPLTSPADETTERPDPFDDPATRQRLTAGIGTPSLAAGAKINAMASVRPAVAAEGQTGASAYPQSKQAQSNGKSNGDVGGIVAAALESRKEQIESQDKLQREKRERQENRRALSDSRRKIAGLNHGIYPRMTFTNYLPKSPGQDFALDICKTYAAAYPDCDGLALLGNVGVGKTHLLVATGHAILDRFAVRTEIVSMLSIFDALILAMKGSNQIDGRARSFADVLGHYAGLELVLLDDFGTERGEMPGWTAEKFYWLINEWCVRKTHVVLTSNLTHEDWGKRYDARIVDRLHYLMGGTDDPAIVTVKGPSGRGSGRGLSTLMEASQNLKSNR